MGVVALILVMMIHPRLASQNFSFTRAQALVPFFSEVVTTGKFDPQQWWKLREFYSPGSFTYNPDIIQVNITQQIRPRGPFSGPLPLFTYTSNRLASTDYVIPNTVIANSDQDGSKIKLLQKLATCPTSGATLYQDSSTILFMSDSNTLHFLFVRPLSDMRQANGLFDYDKQDLFWLRDTSWAEVTTLKLDCCPNLKQELLQLKLKKIRS